MSSNVDSFLPSTLHDEVLKLFPGRFLVEGVKFLKQGKVSISFQKGSPGRFLVVSGIVQDYKTFETRITCRPLAENSSEVTLSSFCQCHLWTEHEHCPHALGLFLKYRIKDFSLEGEYIDIDRGVCAHEFGSVIAGPHRLKNAPGNATYHMLQYCLTSGEKIPFPIPREFKGTLRLHIGQIPYQFEEKADYRLKFSYVTPEGKTKENISLFEHLYLFDWDSGLLLHLPLEIMDVLSKIKNNEYRYRDLFNDFLRLTENAKQKGILHLSFDDIDVDELGKVEAHPRISIREGERKAYLKLSIDFLDELENPLPVPPGLLNFVFEDGFLSSFPKKPDAYAFIGAIVESFKSGTSQFGKQIRTSSDRELLQEHIHFLLNHDKQYVYNVVHKNLCVHDVHLLKVLGQAMFECFGESFFRFSEYDETKRTVNFEVSSQVLFSGLAEFYKRLNIFNVPIFYQQKRVKTWSSSIRLERRHSSIDWFNVDLIINKGDLEIIKHADELTHLAHTSQGLVLLNPENQDLLKFMKKYTRYEQQAQQAQAPVSANVDATSEVNPQEEIISLTFKKARLFELFELKKLGIPGALTEEEEKLCDNLQNLKAIPEYPIPTELQHVLRPYQAVGYYWLRFLYENRLGACLADDMGLGKTIQTIAFIQSIYEKIGRVLIICPVTILLNWQNEFQKFSNIEALVYHGQGRSEIEEKKNFKVMLTSYGIMKKEASSFLQDLHFDIIIFDEVQNLKNINSIGAISSRQLNGDFRICLTGTPVENDLSEFYNIMDICVPGVWGDLRFIRSSSSSKTRLLAKKTARPFILRRTKAQVLTDLPEKIESHVFLEFSEAEQAVYAKTLLEIKASLDNSNNKRRYGEVLKGLLVARQLCLWQKAPHPELCSSKIDFLMENLAPIIEEGHQALVFSQFTTYLDIIQDKIRGQNWKFSRIDGQQSLQKRQKEVEVFQSGQTKVFLISLKAGGTGLNLTAASYVFLMDPWWNPAVEGQAIDRAHRIGQKNKLTVYRPVIKNSVEERVLKLQEYKKELFNDLLSDKDDEYFSGKLSYEDLRSLLE